MKETIRSEVDVNYGTLDEVVMTYITHHKQAKKLAPQAPPDLLAFLLILSRVSNLKAPLLRNQLAWTCIEREDHKPVQRTDTGMRCLLSISTLNKSVIMEAILKMAAILEKISWPLSRIKEQDKFYQHGKFSTADKSHYHGYFCHRAAPLRTPCFIQENHRLTLKTVDLN